MNNLNQNISNLNNQALTPIDTGINKTKLDESLKSSLIDGKIQGAVLRLFGLAVKLETDQGKVYVPTKEAKIWLKAEGHEPIEQSAKNIEGLLTGIIRLKQSNWGSAPPTDLPPPPPPTDKIAPPPSREGRGQLSSTPEKAPPAPPSREGRGQLSTAGPPPPQDDIGPPPPADAPPSPSISTVKNKSEEELQSIMKDTIEARKKDNAELNKALEKMECKNTINQLALGGVDTSKSKLVIKDGQIGFVNRQWGFPSARGISKQAQQTAQEAIDLLNKASKLGVFEKETHASITNLKNILSEYLKDTFSHHPDLKEGFDQAFKKITDDKKNEMNEKLNELRKLTGVKIEPARTEEKYSTEQIQQWLFEGKRAPDSQFPVSQLAIKQKGRKQEASAPKTNFSSIAMLSQGGKYTSRIGVYNGGITDIRADKGQKAAVGDSNNGDLLTGCGFAVATAVVNATGPNLQKDLYNQFGVPGVMEVPKYGEENYGHTEGRGYAVTCDAHDMKDSHNIQNVEFMTVPMNSIEGVRNMYAEAFEHSKDLDFIVMPMAGMSHPVLEGKPELSAQIATEEFKKFVDKHPDSHLKVVFAIFKDPKSEDLYKDAANKLA